MIERIWKRIESFASLWTFVVFLLLFLAFSFFFFQPLGKNYPEGGTFDGRRGWPADHAGRILGGFALSGQLDNYEKQEYGDLLFPIVYTLGFAIAIVGLGKSLPVPHALVLFPFLAALGDYTENLCILAMIKHYRAEATVPHTLAVIASSASVVKWGAIAVSVGLMIVLTVWRYGARRPQSPL